MAAGVVRSNVDGGPWMSCSSSTLWETALCSCSALNEPGLQNRLTRSLRCTELLLKMVFFFLFYRDPPLATPIPRDAYLPTNCKTIQNTLGQEPS